MELLRISHIVTYPELDVEVHIWTSLAPPKLWSYVRDVVIDASLIQRGSWAWMLVPNVLSQVVESVTQLEFRLTLISAQVLVVLQSMTWPTLRVSHFLTESVQLCSYQNSANRHIELDSPRHRDPS